MATKPIALVTGGAGFIGSHAVDHLLDLGYQVRAIDNLSNGREENLRSQASNPDFELIQTDIRNLKPDAPVFRGVERVIHFAGIGDIVPSIERPLEYFSVNAQGTLNVLECARHARVKKLVYAASSSCYGIADPTQPTREDAPIQPMYPYAMSKYQGEQAAFHWNQVYGLPVNSIRIFNAYGPRVRTSGAYGAVFGVFLKQKLAGQPLTVVGDGTQRRDFVFVTDVAKAFVAAVLTDVSGEVFNLGTGSPQSVNRLVELIGGETTHLPKRPGEPDVTWADPTKIKSLLKWAPEVPFEEGVARMLAQIDYWKDAPLWNPDSIAKATSTWFNYLGEKND